MDLYYLSNSAIPSSKANSVQIMHMCNAFASIVDRVVLICRKGETVLDDVHAHYGLQRSFEIRPVSVPKVRFMDRFCLATSVVRQLRGTNRATIIYARDLFSAGVVCALISNSHRLVIEVHAPPHNAFWRWWVKCMVASGRLSHVVPISHSLARWYLNAYPGLAEKSIIVAHDGADDAVIAAESAVDIPSHTYRARVGYVGSLRPGKGMELINELAPKMPDVEFHIVGGDPEPIRSWKQKASRNIVFHGFVSPSVASSYIAAFDVVLAPYQTLVLVGQDNVDISRWMSPLKIFEYMSQGKALVCSNLPVLREVLKDGANALLADPEDSSEWKEKITQLIDDNPLRQRIGNQAREDFIQYHTWQRRADAILERLSVRSP